MEEWGTSFPSNICIYSLFFDLNIPYSKKQSRNVKKGLLLLINIIVGVPNAILLYHGHLNYSSKQFYLSLAFSNQNKFLEISHIKKFYGVEVLGALRHLTGLSPSNPSVIKISIRGVVLNNLPLSYCFSTFISNGSIRCLYCNSFSVNLNTTFLALFGCPSCILRLFDIETIAEICP